MTDRAGNTQRLLFPLLANLMEVFFQPRNWLSWFFMKLQIISGAAAQHGGLWQPLVNQWQMVFNYQHNSSMVVIICFLLWQIASIYLFISNHKLISKAYCLYLRVPIDKPFLMNGIPGAASPFVSRGETVLLLLPARSLVTRLGLRWIGQPLQPISHRPKETNLATKKT